MNILIISTNRNKYPIPVMPYGACIIAEAAEQAGHNVRFIDLMFEKYPQKILKNELIKHPPDVVGISIRNIDNNDIEDPQLLCKETASFTDIIKKHSKAPIIIGGAAVSVMPEQLLRYTGAQWAVIGNGEIVFPELLSALSCGENPKEVPGIGWIENDTFMKNGNAHLASFSRCIAPDYNRWLNVKAYRSLFTTVPIQTKRGCPFNCVYCTYNISEGRNYHLSTPESVINSVQHLVANGFKDIEFVDNVFNSPYDHAREICEGLENANLNARFQSLEINPKFVDDKLLTAMEKAGFVGMGITAESAVDRVLWRLKKNYTSEEVIRSALAINRHQIPCFWIFMLGGPGETEETIKQTFNFAKTFINPYNIVFFNIGVRIYPGTEIEQIARDDGVLHLDSRQMISPVFYISPKIDLDWLMYTLHKEVATHLNFIDSTSFSLPSLPLIFRLAYKIGLKPPIWKHTRMIRSGLRLLGVEV